MTDADRPAFAAVMLAVAENYGQTLTAQGLALRFEMLAGHDLAAVKRAALAIMASRKYAGMPTVADFLEHLVGGSADDKAEVEADKVLAAMETVGGYRSVVFDDPVTQAVIRNAYGGWAQLCRESSVRDRKWWRKEFAKTYAAYSRQGVRLYGHLPGMAEIANTASGYAPDGDPPVLIGLPDHAARVLREGECLRRPGGVTPPGPPRLGFGGWKENDRKEVARGDGAGREDRHGCEI